MDSTTDCDNFSYALVDESDTSRLVIACEDVYTSSKYEFGLADQSGELDGTYTFETITDHFITCLEEQSATEWYASSSDG